MRFLQPEQYDHLRSAMVALILRYGANFRQHLDRLADFWHGPLYDGGIPLSRTIAQIFTNKHIADILSENPELGQQSKYSRDFWEGLIDAACTRVIDTTRYERLEFSQPPHLRDFLLSDDCGVPIDIVPTPCRLPWYSRTNTLPFLHIPPVGNASDYFAGALASSKPCFSKSGALCGRMKIQVLDTLKRIGVVYDIEKKYVFVPVFYVMLYCGELPFDIFSMWIEKIPSKANAPELKFSSLIAWMHWRMMWKPKKAPIPNGIPFLLSGSYCYKAHNILVKDVNEFMERKRITYVDERILERCKRWYNTDNALRNSYI